jgi:membrane dipeptidase
MTALDNDIVDLTHDRALIVDGRDPTHLMYLFTREEKPDYYDSLHEGGLTAILVDAIWLYDDFGDLARNLYTWYARVAERSQRLAIAHSVADIRKAKAEGKTAFVLTAQNSDWVEEDLSLVPMARRLGIRVSQIVYQSKNAAGDGCGEKNDSGLSKFGVSLVHAFNDAGIVIDLSHAGPKTALDTIRESRQPVIFSHSNARALCEAPRNVDDELLVELARKGGVIGASAYNQVIAPGADETGATMDQFIDQIDYMVNKIGIDHVGFGLDAGEGRTPLEIKILHTKARGLGKAPKVRYLPELDERRKAKNLTRALLRRGYSEEDTMKILGGNFLRVFEEVWGR